MSREVDINRSNYESFVIDYLDGTLSAIQSSYFVEFLENNPDIAEEIAGLNETVIQPDNISYKSKDQLKKKSLVSTSGINEGNYEEVFIAHLEGDLSPKQELELNTFLSKNTSLISEFEISKNLKLEADTRISYDKKDELKKSKSRILPFWYSSAAAVILVLISIWYMDNGPDTNSRETIFDVSEISMIKSNSIKKNILATELDISNRTAPKINYEYEVVTINEVPEKLYASNLIARGDYKIVAYANEIYLVPQYQPLPEIIYDDLVETEELIVTIPKKKKKKTLFASIFNNQWDKIKSNISSRKPEEKTSNDPKYVQVLDTGIKVFNTLTGSETYTSKSYNTDGKLTGYQIEGRDIMLNRETPSGSSR